MPRFQISTARDGLREGVRERKWVERDSMGGATYLLRVSVQKSEVDLAAQFLAKGGTLGGAAARGKCATRWALSRWSGPAQSAGIVCPWR